MPAFLAKGTEQKEEATEMEKGADTYLEQNSEPRGKKAELQNRGIL